MTDKLDYLRALEGYGWRRAPWARPPNNPEWDHDHCVACWAKFSDNVPDAFRKGHTHGVAPAEEWVCDECFSRLAKELRWTLVGPESSK
jgi:hypothetical protein